LIPLCLDCWCLLSAEIFLLHDIHTDHKNILHLMLRLLFILKTALLCCRLSTHVQKYFIPSVSGSWDCYGCCLILTLVTGIFYTIMSRLLVSFSFLLPDIHTDYKNNLHMRVWIVCGSLDNYVVLPYTRTGYINTQYCHA
jgi:hypothetical protein